MAYKDVKCRILEEELRKFWPQWHVVRQISEGAFGEVYEIRKEEYKVEFRSALKVLHIAGKAGGDAILPTTVSLLQQDNPEREDYGRKTAISRVGALDSEVAQKAEIMQADGLPEEFRNEIKIMETLRGAPNIVTMEDVHFEMDSQMGTLYIRMELLTSLQSYVRSRPFLTVPEIICIGLDVCRALAFCEEKHIIHRDIKPANIFIDEFGAYKVGDFGVSRRSETVHAAQPMTGIGTISYMAPEIYYGKPYNNTVDLYALGLVLYQLLNRGRMPFMPDYPTECITADIDSSNYKRLHGEEIPRLPFTDYHENESGFLSSKNSADPNYIYTDSARALDKVIRRACSYRVEDRYRTATDMSCALDACRHLYDGKKTAAAKKSPDFPDSKRFLTGGAILAAACMIFLIYGSGVVRVSSPSVNITAPDTDGLSQTANYTAPEAEGSSQVISEEETRKDIPASKSENDLSYVWEEVITASEDGTYKEKYKIGDTLELDLGQEGMITMELVAMDVDEFADGSGKAHMTWIAKELLNTEHVMNMTDTNKGGWPTSEMRVWLQEKILPMIPEVVRSSIKIVTKYSYSYSDKGTISSADSIWIPSQREISGAEFANEDKGVEYTKAYPDDDSRQKGHVNASSISWWWLRSASGGYSRSFDNFFDVGFVDSNADYEGGVAIGFCL